MADEIDKALTVLKAHGYKITPKRKEMLSFFEGTTRYLSAREVHQFLQKTYPSISYDTVYRNLHDFSRLEILEETELNAEKKFKYCCQHQGQHHHHFICTQCGKTKDVKMCPMTYFGEQLPGYLIEGHRFEIYGLCDECVQKQN